MKKPNFFIIGAPKCGTTSLASWLAKHPHVFMSPVKEPNYFNTDIFTPNRINESDYYSLFDGVDNDHFCIGEASTRYLYSKVACKNILSTFEYPKFIVIVRNPIDMIYSLHNHLCFLGVEQFKDFREAWALKDRRENGELIKDVCTDPDSLAYGRIGLLGEQVERLFETVPASQRLVLCFDDLISSPENVYRQMLDFLEIKYDGRSDFFATNQSMSRKIHILGDVINFLGNAKERAGIRKGLGVLALLNKWNRVDKPRKPIEEDLVLEMKRYFYEDIVKLEKLLGRDFSHWIESDLNAR